MTKKEAVNSASFNNYYRLANYFFLKLHFCVKLNKTIRIVFKYEDEFNSAIDFIKKYNCDTMDENNSENIYEEARSVWDSKKEEYFFSVVDVISVLTDSTEPRKYWSV